MHAIADFLFEVGFLHKTPRTGYRFLGSGNESVSEHSFRSAVIGYVLSKMRPDSDPHKLILMCLFHDVAEARTGDQNYVYKQYVTVDENKAVSHLCESVPFGNDLGEILAEYKSRSSLEAQLAHDADQLDLLLSLKEQTDLGNSHADEWVPHLLKRLYSDAARSLAETIQRRDHKDWWFRDHEEWWTPDV